MWPRGPMGPIPASAPELLCRALPLAPHPPAMAASSYRGSSFPPRHLVEALSYAWSAPFQILYSQLPVIEDSEGLFLTSPPTIFYISSDFSSS